MQVFRRVCTERGKSDSMELSCRVVTVWGSACCVQYSVMALPLLPSGTAVILQQLFTAVLEVNLIKPENSPCRCCLISAVLVQRGVLSFC